MQIDENNMTYELELVKMIYDIAKKCKGIKNKKQFIVDVFIDANNLNEYEIKIIEDMIDFLDNNKHNKI